MVRNLRNEKQVFSSWTFFWIRIYSGSTTLLLVSLQQYFQSRVSDLECQLTAERTRRISDAEEWKQFQADLLMTVRVANDFQVNIFTLFFPFFYYFVTIIRCWLTFFFTYLSMTNHSVMRFYEPTGHDMPKLCPSTGTVSRIQTRLSYTVSLLIIVFALMLS
jgi:hypothetical protein